MSDVEAGFGQLEALTSKQRRACLETLLKIFRNVAANPDQAKFRTLRLSNQRFRDEVWSHEGARTLMLASGWVLLEDLVHLPEGIQVSQDTLEMLVERRSVKPDEREWVSETKIEGEANLALKKEEILRQKALKEKQKQMAILKKDMAERKAIANRIVADHRNDLESKKVTKPSIATPRGAGGAAKMDDIKPKGGG